MAVKCSADVCCVSLSMYFVQVPETGKIYCFDKGDYGFWALL